MKDRYYRLRELALAVRVSQDVDFKQPRLCLPFIPCLYRVTKVVGGHRFG